MQWSPKTPIEDSKFSLPRLWLPLVHFLQEAVSSRSSSHPHPHHQPTAVASHDTFDPKRVELWKVASYQLWRQDEVLSPKPWRKLPPPLNIEDFQVANVPRFSLSQCPWLELLDEFVAVGWSAVGWFLANLWCKGSVHPEAKGPYRNGAFATEDGEPWKYDTRLEEAKPTSVASVCSPTNCEDSMGYLHQTRTPWSIPWQLKEKKNTRILCSGNPRNFPLGPKVGKRQKLAGSFWRDWLRKSSEPRWHLLDFDCKWRWSVFTGSHLVFEANAEGISKLLKVKESFRRNRSNRIKPIVNKRNAKKHCKCHQFATWRSGK